MGNASISILWVLGLITIPYKIISFIHYIVIKKVESAKIQFKLHPILNYMEAKLLPTWKKMDEF